MFDLPIHPALVHLPIGFAVLMPLITLVVWHSINKNWIPQKSWILLIFIQLSIFLTGYAAMQTGGQDEEIVERVVSEKYIEEHEEKAETFVWFSGALCLLLGSALFAPKGLKKAATGLSVIGVTANLALATFVGHTGGELIYKHNTASAHVQRLIKKKAKEENQSASKNSADETKSSSDKTSDQTSDKTQE